MPPDVTSPCMADFMSLLAACSHAVTFFCLTGSDCKPCLQEFTDHSTPALEYHNPKSFLPSLTAEDDTFCTSMAEEKASVLFPSAATMPGRSQGQQSGWSAPYSEVE